MDPWEDPDSMALDMVGATARMFGPGGSDPFLKLEACPFGAGGPGLEFLEVVLEVRVDPPQFAFEIPLLPRPDVGEFSGEFLGKRLVQQVPPAGGIRVGPGRVGIGGAVDLGELVGAKPFTEHEARLADDQLEEIQLLLENGEQVFLEGTCLDEVVDADRAFLTEAVQRALAVHPKFFYFDAGVFRANRPTGPLDSPSDIDGAALEGLVAQHLRAWCDYTDGEHRLHYCQTRSQNEVDFVVYGPLGLRAIEVKNSAQVRPEDLRGLRAFGEDYPESCRWLLYRSAERCRRDGVLCLPVEEFLRQLRPGSFPD